jgi:4-oxalocrotonate tautomerase
MINLRYCEFDKTQEITMPLTRVSLLKGKSNQARAAILDGLYQAMRETFDVPEDDCFMTLSEHEPDDFRYGANYLKISRTDDLVLIQITVSNTRTVAQKKALYAAVNERLTRNPGLRPEDIFINLVEVAPENWSFGHGIAQYAKS